MLGATGRGTHRTASVIASIIPFKVFETLPPTPLSLINDNNFIAKKATVHHLRTKLVPIATSTAGGCDEI